LSIGYFSDDFINLAWYAKTAMIFILSISLIFTIYNAVKLLALKPGVLDHRIVAVINCYIGIHVACVLAYRIWFPELKHLNRLAPFILVYGPLIYLFIIGQKKNEISSRRIFAHLVLPVLAWILFVILVAGNLWGTYLDRLYRPLLRTLAAGSFFLYTILVANKFFRNEIKKSTKIFLLCALMLLICMGVIVTFFNLHKKELYATITGPDALSTMVYSIMLLASLLIFTYHYRYKSRSDEILQMAIDSGSYSKSAITQADMENYEQKIISLMTSQQTYLNADLSLNRLAEILHLPKHYVTQVLNVQMKQSYHQYINTLRILHACRLINADPGALLKNIAEDSGFTSVVTFNRSFKTVMNMLPNEYKNSIKV
jgi:AraC-like DNA-binding protein